MIGMGTVLLVAVLWCLAIAILAATFLPMWKTSLWWVRILDFPRLQIAFAERARARGGARFCPVRAAFSSRR